MRYQGRYKFNEWGEQNEGNEWDIRGIEWDIRGINEIWRE